MKRGLCGAPKESRAAPGDPRPPRPSPGRQRTDKTRHFRAMRRHFFESVENSGDPGRQRTDKTRHFREAGRSVCERECRSWVAGPIIYGTCTRRVAQFARGSAGPAKRVAQFARGSAGPGSPDPLFTALPRGRCLSLREVVPALGPRPHYLRHFDEGPAGVANGPRKHVTFATRGRTFARVLRILARSDGFPR